MQLKKAVGLFTDDAWGSKRARDNLSKGISPDTIIGHYRVVSKIGAGGMGEVYLAQDTRLDRKVAIKFLNILTVYEIGEVDGKNYIATELIEGQTLREHLSHKESLQLNQILTQRFSCALIQCP